MSKNTLRAAAPVLPQVLDASSCSPAQLPASRLLLEIQPPIFRQLEHREEKLATFLDRDVFAVRYLALFLCNNRQNDGLDRVLPQLKVVIGW
jgi:hypothetical protein